MRALILIAILLSISCSTSIKSPLTQFEYTGFIKEEGVGISFKPPFWEAGVSLYKSFTEEEEK